MMDFCWTYNKENVSGQLCQGATVRADWCCAEHRKRWHQAIRAQNYRNGLMAGLEAALPFVRDKNRHQVFDLLDYVRKHGCLPGGDDGC